MIERKVKIVKEILVNVEVKKKLIEMMVQEKVLVMGQEEEKEHNSSIKMVDGRNIRVVMES